MNKQEKTTNEILQSLPPVDKDDIPERGGKVARTTFNLPQEIHETLDWLQKRMNQSNNREFFEWLLISNKGTEKILSLTRSPPSIPGPARRKTFVVSDRVISKLKELSTKFEAPRDNILSWLLFLWRAWIEGEEEKEKQRLEKVLPLLNDLCDKGNEIENGLDPELHEGFRFGFSRIMLAIENLISATEESIKTGEYIDYEKI